MNKPNSTEEYISTFPPKTQKLLEQIRSTIRKAAPEAKEKISYGIPTFDLHGNLVHFAGYKQHIGFYPGAGGIAAFKAELSAYKGAKGSVQFPIDQPLPLALVTKIVKFRVKQSMEKVAAKKGDFLSSISAPARRALEAAGITSPAKLSRYSEAELLKLHGMGPGSLPKLRKALEDEGLVFRA